jgi:plastocyanin
MRITLALPALVIACVRRTWGCSGSHLPSSPSALSLQTTASPTAGRFRALDDPAMPTPMQVFDHLVGSFGSNAFMPNPTLANMGDQIVFTNTDLVMHHIVLDDGNGPWRGTAGPIKRALRSMTPTATYHCTIHPDDGWQHQRRPPVDPARPIRTTRHTMMATAVVTAAAITDSIGPHKCGPYSPLKTSHHPLSPFPFLLI